jgi:hypothetical protein
VKGTDQTGDAFWKRVVVALKAIAPKDPKDCVGKFHNREGNALKTKWNDNISRDVKKFNKALIKVLSSNLTGVNEQNKINIAVSIMMGKCDGAHYRHKDFDPYEWMYYKAWVVLKDHPTFKPPNLKEDSIDIDDETEPETELDINLSDDPTTFVTPNFNGNVPTMSRHDSDTSSVKPKSLHRVSRGPGLGKKATREKAVAEANTKRKLDILDRIATTMEENTAINRKKARDINMFVRNTSRAQSFMVGYKGQKVEGQTEHQKMHFNALMNNAIEMESLPDSDDEVLYGAREDV